jgi:hypothetical protein
MKKALIMLIISMAASGLFAEGGIDTIHFKDGKSIRGRITERESFPEKRVTIIDEGGKSHSYDLADIERISESSDGAPDQVGDPGGQGPEPFDAPGFFAVNYLGLLQFGPLIHLGFRMAQDIYLIPHLRFHGIGALSWILFEDTSFIDTALGLEFQVQQPLGGSSNAMYYSLGAECLAAQENGFLNGPPTVEAFANIGHRWWNPEKKSFLNAGLIGGISYDPVDEYLFPFFMAELTSGWPFPAR